MHIALVEHVFPYWFGRHYFRQELSPVPVGAQLRRTTVGMGCWGPPRPVPRLEFPTTVGARRPPGSSDVRRLLGSKSPRTHQRASREAGARVARSARSGLPCLSDSG